MEPIFLFRSFKKKISFTEPKPVSFYFYCWSKCCCLICSLCPQSREKKVTGAVSSPGRTSRPFQPPSAITCHSFPLLQSPTCVLISPPRSDSCRACQSALHECPRLFDALCGSPCCFLCLCGPSTVKCFPFKICLENHSSLKTSFVSFGRVNQLFLFLNLFIIASIHSLV